MDRGRTLVLATQSRGKIEEFRSLCAGLPLQVRGIAEIVDEPPRVVEDGATYADHALKKARAAARATEMLSLGDDSGLEVDALGGQPGVRSARFAHERATDAENVAALLEALNALGEGQTRKPYRARFRCVLALVAPRISPSTGMTDTQAEAFEGVFEGICEGTITRSPRGAFGFGYDPVFVVDGMGDKTMADLCPEEKNRLSHRARAFAALRPVLIRILSERPT